MPAWDMIKKKLNSSDDSSDDTINQISAQQEAQQSNVLPTERQPPMQGIANPQDESLQHPSISPEELIAGGVAGPLARAAMSASEVAGPAMAQVAKPAFQGIKNLVGDEAGVFRLSGSGMKNTPPALGPEKLQPLQRLQQTLGHEITPAGDVLNIDKAKNLMSDANNAFENKKILLPEWQLARQHLDNALKRGY